jgi:predicted nucleic acid-binding protein
MRAIAGHAFWTDDVSPVDPGGGVFGRVVGYRQVTDAHLVSLAQRQGGALATFDRGVRELAPDAPSSVEIIP